MGRVRRYKKYKACDPASKKFGKEVDTKHDEPPELFEQRARKINRDREDKWDNEEKKEHLLQREALRELRLTQQKEQLKEKKLESKRANESMQAFKARIKQETRKTLVEEVHKMTATAQKRKMRLKERSLKRKSKKGGSAEEPEQVDFFSAENGHLRPSDLGESRSSFRGTETIAFGERAERPPDLQQFTAKFKVAKDKDAKDKHAQQVLQAAEEQKSEGEGAGESSAEEEEVPMTKNMRNKKRKARSLAQRCDMDGDDGLEGFGTSSSTPSFSQQRHQVSAPPLGQNKRVRRESGKGQGQQAPPAQLTRKSEPAAVLGVKAQNEMDALRLKVQEAYRQLRDKRRTQV